MRFTHLVNPFAARPQSEHDIAQRITFASMNRSVTEARAQGVDVEVLAVCYPGDAEAVAAPAVNLPPLQRSVQDIQVIQPPRQLPLLTDLLAAGDRHGQGDYLIYTNIDISLQPHFYVALDKMVATGASGAYVINRRTIGAHYKSPEELPAMYADAGREHPGYDCFVFPRAWVSSLQLGNVCIGTRHFDGLLIANLDLLSEHRLEICRDLHLTFHIGDEQSWAARNDYDEYNLRETTRVLGEMGRAQPPRPNTHYAYLYNGYQHQGRPHMRLLRQIKRIDALRRIGRRFRKAS